MSSFATIATVFEAACAIFGDVRFARTVSTFLTFTLMKANCEAVPALPGFTINPDAQASPHMTVFVCVGYLPVKFVDNYHEPMAINPEEDASGLGHRIGLAVLYFGDFCIEISTIFNDFDESISVDGRLNIVDDEADRSPFEMLAHVVHGDQFVLENWFCV